MRPRPCALTLAASLLFPVPSVAAVFDLPPADVSGMVAAGGPSFTLPVDLQPDDSLRALITGTVDFNVGNLNNYSADWNAAGIVVRSRSTILDVGGTDPSFIDQGWLRLALGNDAMGFFPLLEPVAANGLGSADPPDRLLLNRTVGEVFDAPGFAGIPTGTVLQYRVFDSVTSDNSGGFVVSVVPEPCALAVALVGAASVVRRRRERIRGAAHRLD